MATTAYLRVSTGTQDLVNQKLAILEYARRKKFPINEFVEVQISSRKKPQQRGIDGMLERLAPGDRLIVSELSRLGRSLGQVIHIVDELVKRKIRFTAIKESIHFEEKAGLADQGYGCLVRSVRRGRERLDLRAHTRRIGIRPRQGPIAWPPEGCAGKVAAGWERGRDPPPPAKAGLKGVNRQDCRRHAAHHSPLYQDKAVTPTSLKDIFTPIWSGPFPQEIFEDDRLPELVQIEIMDV